MLSSLLKNTGDEEFGVAEGRSYQRRGYSFQWWHIALGVAILFPYISIFVLFGLVGNLKTETTNVRLFLCLLFLRSLTPCRTTRRSKSPL